MADRIGQQFGNYRLIRLLGRGSLGEVYLGEHIHLGINAAIKVPHVSLEYVSQEDFLKEARLLTRLDHPYIERVLDFGVENTTPYLVTVYAPGGTLRNANPRGNLLPLAQTVSYAKQIASALQYLHDHNIIHRDVKPENMLLRANGEVLLSDPGIATFTSDNSLNSPTITSSSNITGNATYMAPEQIMGRPVRASDQYSLAIVVYEWLTGKAPFRGTSDIDILIKQMNEPPPPLRAINPGIPPDVEEVVMTALAKDPKRRFVSMQAFATAFEQAANLGRQTQASPSFYGAGDWPTSAVPPRSIESAPALQGQSAPSAPGNDFDPDLSTQTRSSLPAESDDYRTGSMSPGMTRPSQLGAGTPSPKETPSANRTPFTPPMAGSPSFYENTGIGAFQIPPASGNASRATPPMASRRPSIAKGLGSALKKIASGRKDNNQQAKDLSLFAIARTTVDDNNRAIVGNTYIIEAGISQNSPEGFRGEPIRVRTQSAVDSLLFDILIHPGDNIKLMGAWYQRLRYNPGIAEPQFITCPFRLKAPGRSHLIVHFYRERQWLKAIRFEFEGFLQSQPAATMSWR